MMRPRISRKPAEVALRHRAKALGYDVYDIDTGFVLAKRRDGRREVVLGKDGGVSLETIEYWLDENHP
jgi:hypothetical protein